MSNGYAKWVGHSRTILTNSISILVLLAGFLTSDDVVQYIQDHPGAAVGYAVVVNIVNIVLRFLTTKPVEWEKPPA